MARIKKNSKPMTFSVNDDARDDFYAVATRLGYNPKSDDFNRSQALADVLSYARTVMRFLDSAMPPDVSLAASDLPWRDRTMFQTNYLGRKLTGGDVFPQEEESE